MFTSVSDIKNRLFELQDTKYRAFQSRLMPNIDPVKIIGVRTPEIRKLAKELSKSELKKEFMALLPHEYYEENNLHGALIELLSDFKETIAAVELFLPYVDNWATCDLISPKVFKKDLSALLPKIKEWTHSDKTYTIRFGIEMLMSFYLDKNFKPEYNLIISEIRSKEYYVNMMIAWYFATALAKQYDETVVFIENKCLDTWTHNKAIQKGTESLRLTDEQKIYLKSLKLK